MTIDAIFPEDLQNMTKALGEKNYTLVDVRQPQEYQDGHIPGARLIPLPQLKSGLEELRHKPNLIFYCHSGVRSQMASTWAVDHLGPDTRVANMVGGFMAWEGKSLREMPRLQLFDEPKSLQEALLKAMNLEKGAQRFYLAAATAAETVAPAFARTLRTLADVEQAHARVLDHRLCQIQDQKQDHVARNETFEQRYAPLAGNILEGGLTLEGALARMNKAQSRFCLEVTDLALEIELMAYDLYKNLAGTYAGTELDQMFLKLAEDEQGHQRLLVRQLPDCPA